MKDSLKLEIYKRFIDFLEEFEEQVKDKSLYEMIDIYLSSIYYEILNDIELNRVMFEVEKDLTTYESIQEIEDIITRELISKFKDK